MKKRKLLTLATIGMAITGIALASIPFISSLSPNANTLSALPGIKISQIKKAHLKYMITLFMAGFITDIYGVYLFIESMMEQ